MHTSFLPAVDSFRFINDWVYDEVEKARARQILLAATPVVLVALAPLAGPLFPLAGLAPLIGRELIDRFDSHVGFCGGMVAAAADYHRLGTLVPRGAGVRDQPDRRSAAASRLRTYILGRLWDGLAVDTSRFVEWMALLHLVPEAAGGGAPALLRRTRAEIDRITQVLDRDRTPVPLGIIGTTRSPFINHTMLAVGYVRTGSSRIELQVYDPNVPGEEVTLKLDLSDERGLVADEGKSAHRERGPLRGVLLQHYVAQTPPPAMEATVVASPSTARLGEPVRLQAVLTNQGYAPTEPVFAWIEGQNRPSAWPWDPQGDPGGEPAPSPLGPASSRRLDVEARPSETGDWTYTVGVVVPVGGTTVFRRALRPGSAEAAQVVVRVSG